MEQIEWRSPRKVEQEVSQYRAKRFEDYMQMVDRGELERHIAITALREEIEYSETVIGESRDGKIESNDG